MAGAPRRQGHLATYGLLIGFAAPDGDERPLGSELHVLDIERYQFGSSSGKREADEKHGAISDVLRAIPEPVEDGEQIVSEKCACLFGGIS